MNVNLKRVGFYAALYPIVFLVGVIIGLLLVQWIGFYVDPAAGLVGSDYFYFDFCNHCYSLTGGL